MAPGIYQKVKRTLSILIVNWHSRDYLQRCLESVEATCRELSPQVIVVDGASFDGCDQMMARQFPSAKFIQSEHNIGFGRCNNLGLAQINSDLVLLLNPDTELHNGALARLMQVLDDNPEYGIVSGRLLNSDGTLQSSCVQSLPTPINQALDCDFLRKVFPASRLWGTGAAFASETPIEVEAVSGACMLLRTEVFRGLGGFRDDYFMYGEDIDLCYRVRAQGLKVIFVPDAKTVHHGGGSSRTQFSGFSDKMLRVAGETYFRQNCGKAAALLYRLLQAVSAIVRLPLIVLAFLMFSGERRLAARVSAQKWMVVLRWALGERQTLPRTSPKATTPVRHSPMKETPQETPISTI